MDNKVLNRVFGLIAFLVAFIVYSLTVQDSVPFWDCGEFSAAAIWQQVPHPPGTPLFLLIGKVFDLLIFWGDPGWKINMVSVFSSAITVGLLYFITVMVINNLRTDKIKDTADALAVYGSSLVGALAFTFSDTFWFNAVESEVYAMSSLFVAVIVYLMMKWNEQADKPGHEKYLLLIAYVIGLSSGVHLLAILTVFSVIFLVYFRKYEFSISGFIKTGIIALIAFYIIYPFIIKYIPAFLAGHTSGRNEIGEYAIENSSFLVLVGFASILAIVGGFVYSLKTKNNILKLVTSAAFVILIGYTTYTQILLRSNANPPMNENTPKTFKELASYLGREQYGNDASWPRRIKRDEYFTRHYVSKDENGEYVYGPWYPPSLKRVTTKDGSQVSLPVFDKINVAGELAYLWKYQISHMYLRYFGWNFIGRSSDIQDDGVALFDKKMSAEAENGGYAHLFPIRFFALPFIFGLIGLIFHSSRDRKMAFIHIILFLLMGVLAAIAQQQQHPQPRERDYFYAGSFMVWCMWIGMGAYYLIESLAKKKITTPIVAGILLASTILVPVNMAISGWAIHDRTGNYLPFDYAYNLLQSADENAIIFTNGDNDTFPVWFVQDVMGVRRDVRIVNLSLGNTLWYVDQLKNAKPWGAEKIPLTFSDESLRVDETSARALSYDFGEAYNLRIPVKREILEQYTDDELILEKGLFEAKFTGKQYTERDGKTIYLFRVQDKLVRDILENTRFERPVYYSTSVGQDAFCNLDNFFRFEGFLMRICPVPQRSNLGEKMEIDVMASHLLNVDNTDNFSQTPQLGVKLRGLSNPNVYMDPVHTRLMSTYRQLYTSLARAYMMERDDKEMAANTLDTMNKYISNKQFPMDYVEYFRQAELYKDVDREDAASHYADLGLEDVRKVISDDKSEVIRAEIQGRYYGPHRFASRMYELKGDYQGAKDVLNQLLTKVLSLENELKAVGGYDAQLRTIESNIVDLMSSIDNYDIKVLEEQGKYKEALELVEKKMTNYGENQSDRNSMLARMIYPKYMELNQKISSNGEEIEE